MSAEAIGAAPVNATLVVVPGQVEETTNPALVGLPPPLLSSGEPADVLGMLLAMMDRLASQGVQESTRSVKVNQDKLAEALDKFRAKMEEIARKAEAAKKKDDGWGILGDICSAVSDFVGDVVGQCFGSLTEVSVDLVRGQVDVLAGLIKGGDLEQLLKQELGDLTSGGEVSKKLHGATRGVTDFQRDLVNAATGMLEAIANGQDVRSALVDFGKDAWNSFVNNIIENKDVMEVLFTAMQGIALASAVVSGGTLGLVAVGLFALSMVDQHTGLCNEVFGDEAGRYVSLGINLAAAVCMGFSGGGSSALGEIGGLEGLNHVDVQRLVAQITRSGAMVGGVVSIGAGLQWALTGSERSEQLRDSADLMKIMNLMAAIQRNIDNLLSEAQERTENRDRIRDGGAETYQLQAQSYELAASGIRA